MLAMVDNDNADILDVRGALESIASKLAPTRVSVQPGLVHLFLNPVPSRLFRRIHPRIRA
ncbi:hypothetical protein B0D71_11795 [Pseudomonas laurylsulfativorans]|uniref:Uncharacterized protein n=1 Tax=Pseudomonas laurylsulfativorans TaxID=1943631 RepID=A0A2S3VQC4_9PSED|nr:hypothetical protein B0D71_11795 [Pseudomonas laurylsulfativorans]